MAVIDQVCTDRYAIYNGDSCEVLPTLPDASIDLSVYSPPFAQPGGGALYHYSSSPRDLSNARTFPEFLDHYAFIVRELHRLTKPGRMSVVHVADVPSGNSGCDHLFDLPGEVIRLHEEIGFRYAARYCIWKEPLGVRNRTMAKNLAHKAIVEDSTECSNAGADFLLLFRREGTNAVPVEHPHGLMEYAGEREVPKDLHRFRGWTGKQTENRYSHWIWRQYASCVWDDVRLDNVLPYREARDPEDEKHVHPLQLDVIARALALWSNPGETLLTPFMGVGSEVYGAVVAGRRGIGVELKNSYFRQAVRNLEAAKSEASKSDRQATLALGEASA
jgi:DNA modification methylase